MTHNPYNPPRVQHGYRIPDDRPRVTDRNPHGHRMPVRNCVRAAVADGPARRHVAPTYTRRASSVPSFTLRIELMSDNVNHIILEHLKALRNDVSIHRAETREGFRVVNARLTALEGTVGVFRQDMANLAMSGHEGNIRMDNFDTRLGRIETQIGLVGGS